MKKRTNISEKIVELIAKILIPIFLIIAVIPIFRTDNNEKINDTTPAIEQTYNVYESEQIYSSYATPQDVLNIMNSATKIYDNLSKDGKIIDEDYSQKNATAELSGMFFRNSTFEHKIEIADYMNRKIYADIVPTQPTVLVYHTHGSEAYELIERDYYSNSRATSSTDTSETVVRVGEEICQTLESKGYKTIHIKEIFDYKYSGAYERSRRVVSEILKSNPSIQIVLDIHRDTIYQKDGTRVRTVTEINGKKAAQILITTGCEDGNVTSFPNWEKNLTFALRLQEKISVTYPSLLRPLSFASRKYNMDLLPCALNIDIGTDANTLEQAVYSARIFGEMLAKLMKEIENQ